MICMIFREVRLVRPLVFCPSCIGNDSRFWISCLGHLVYLRSITFKLFGSPIFWPWWRLFQKHVVRTKLYIYIIIIIYGREWERYSEGVHCQTSGSYRICSEYEYPRLILVESSIRTGDGTAREFDPLPDTDLSTRSHLNKYRFFVSTNIKRGYSYSEQIR
jgi:hypothetical protein